MGDHALGLYADTDAELRRCHAEHRADRTARNFAGAAGAHRVRHRLVRGRWSAWHERVCGDVLSDVSPIHWRGLGAWRRANRGHRRPLHRGGHDRRQMDITAAVLGGGGSRRHLRLDALRADPRGWRQSEGRLTGRCERRPVGASQSRSVRAAFPVGARRLRRVGASRLRRSVQAGFAAGCDRLAGFRAALQVRAIGRSVDDAL